MSSVHPKVVRRFLCHVGRVHAGQQRELVRNDLYDHIERVKAVAGSRVVDRDRLASELRALEEKLANSLDEQSAIVVTEEQQTSQIHTVTHKIEELNTKLNAYHEFEKSRSKRIEDVEKKLVDNAVKEKDEIKLVSEKLKELGELYTRVKASGEADHDRLEQIRTRIDDYKNKLEKIK